jgi:hypothetical protein
VAARELVWRKPVGQIERTNHITLIGAMRDDAAEGDEDRAEIGQREEAISIIEERFFLQYFPGYGAESDGRCKG